MVVDAVLAESFSKVSVAGEVADEPGEVQSGVSRLAAVAGGEAATVPLRPVRPGCSGVPELGCSLDEFPEPVALVVRMVSEAPEAGRGGLRVGRRRVLVAGYLLKVRECRGPRKGLRQQPLGLLLPGGAGNTEDALALGHEQLRGP